MQKRDREVTGDVQSSDRHRAVRKLDIFVANWRNDMTRASQRAQPQPTTLASSLSLPLPRIIAPSPEISSQPPQDSASAKFGTCLGYDERMLLHRRDDMPEVERPGRIGVTYEHLFASGLVSLCSRAPVSAATSKDLQLVHTREHIERLEQLGFVLELSAGAPQAMSCPDDLYVCPETPQAARISCGIVVNCAKEVISGRARNAFALVRPPGHHCSCTRPSGFCFFNNVAVAVRVTQRELMKSRRGNADKAAQAAKPKVMVIDWDVHHCDGTESIFYNDPSVLVFSVHQYGSKPRHEVLRRSKADVPDGFRKDHREEATGNLPRASEGSLSSIPNPEMLSDIGADELLAAMDADGALNNTATPQPQPEMSAVDVCPDEQEATRPRRQRAPVDYKALAQRISEEDAAAFANLFGAEGTTDSTDSGASSVSSGSISSDGHQQPARQFAGDTDGNSLPPADEDASPPFYPCTGHADRVGEPGVAEGTNVNFPWPTTGFGDLEYYLVLQEICAPLIQQFKPEVVFISCGFDCAQKDLLGSMNVSPTGFYFMTKLILSLHDKVVVALEGGYNLTSVALSSEAVLRALLEAGDNASRLPPSRMLAHRCMAQISHVTGLHHKYWNNFGEAGEKKMIKEEDDPTTSS